MPKILDPVLKERHAMAIYGCSLAQALAANGGMELRERGSLSMRYISQRGTAKKRGIAWEISFPEWCGIWHESGKLHLRGTGRGAYCMARHGDTGPYAPGNVSICTVEANSSDGICKARNGPRWRAGSKTQAGGGRGWTLRGGRHHKRPYQVVVADKYIGCYATQSQAEAAYQQAAERHVRELQKRGL